MSNSFLLGAFCAFCLLVMHCKRDAKSSTSAVAYDYTIEPGKRVGWITIDKCTRADVLALYGDSARVEEIFLVEGTTGQGVVLFPDNPRNRAEIYWDAEVDPERPVMIRISGEDTDWKTTQGITIGMAMTELERINGKPFSLFGFGWDYGGTVNDWNGGLLDNNMSISLSLSREEEPPAELMGDKNLYSNDPLLRKFAPVVSSMELSFPRSNLLPLLQGRWQSETDKEYIIEFLGNKLRHYNQGKLTLETLLEPDGACQDVACQVNQAKPEGFCFLEKGQYDIQCHLLLYHDGSRLEYTAIGSTGKSLVFTKIL